GRPGLPGPVADTRPDGQRSGAGMAAHRPGCADPGRPGSAPPAPARYPAQAPRLGRLRHRGGRLRRPLKGPTPPFFATAMSKPSAAAAPEGVFAIVHSRYNAEIVQ